MSAPMPASSKALVRLGLSLASQRGEVVASGRITPICVSPPLPLSPLPVSPPAVEESSPPHAAAETATRPITAVTVRRLRSEVRTMLMHPSGQIHVPASGLFGTEPTDLGGVV